MEPASGSEEQTSAMTAAVIKVKTIEMRKLILQKMICQTRNEMRQT
jgi:hypothetical protein